jgi:hypothetical protein
VLNTHVPWNPELQLPSESTEGEELTVVHEVTPTPLENEANVLGREPPTRPIKRPAAIVSLGDRCSAFLLLKLKSAGWASSPIIPAS